MLDLDILKTVLKIRVTTDMSQSRFYQHTLKIERSLQNYQKVKLKKKVSLKKEVITKFFGKKR